MKFPGISGNLVVISEPPPRSGFILEAVEPIHKKRHTVFFKKVFCPELRIKTPEQCQ